MLARIVLEPCQSTAAKHFRSWQQHEQKLSRIIKSVTRFKTALIYETR